MLGNEPTTACAPTLEERMSVCHKRITCLKKVVEAFESMEDNYGRYTIIEDGGERLYTHAHMELRNRKREWKRLKAEAKKKGKK